jgi:ABC-type phosphate transport system substrate-binding protein
MKNLKVILASAILASASGLSHAEVVVVMSTKSAVSELTKDQVSDIFLGKAATFPQGGQAVPIDLAASAPHRDEFYTKVTGRNAAQLKSYWAKQSFSGKGTAPKAVAGDEEVKKLIAANPNTIGYIDKARVDASVKVVFTP